MPPGAEFDHANFVEALLDPEKPSPVAMNRGDGPSAERRFGVYRNNVVVSLIDALEARFPVSLRLVGSAFFRGAAKIFVRQSPPKSPVLAEYGDAFPAFLEGFEPVRAPPYLADVARLEMAVGASYHASNATPLATNAMAAIPTERLGDAVFSLHPSLRLLTSPYPIVSIWRMNVIGDASLIVQETAEDAMVVRPECAVSVSILPKGGYFFVQRLAQGQTLACAANGALMDCGALDLAGVLEMLIARQAVVAVNLGTCR
jgi:hypothetical protein